MSVSDYVLLMLQEMFSFCRRETIAFGEGVICTESKADSGVTAGLHTD